jgi:predicted O-methyltransferase YrrM
MAMLRLEETRAGGPSSRQIADALRRGERPSERHFDRFLPAALRGAPSAHFTPLAVALTAVRWLREMGAKTIVDVGAGAGKFCVVAALASDCEVTGIEQRPRLVHAARELAALFGAEDRVRFLEGELGRDPLPIADAYFLFNPFGENVLAAADCIDHDVELSKRRYLREVAWLERQLMLARPSICVVDYAGFGGRMPASYRRLRVDMQQRYCLQLWQKQP